jgi:hypothetical protein
MKNLTLLAIATSFFLTGCVSTQPAPTQKISIPSLGQKETATLGENLLMQATGHIANSITLGSVDGATTRIDAGKFCQLNEKSDFFTSFGGAAYVKNAAGDATSIQRGVTYANGKVCIPGTMGFGCYSSDEVSIEYKANDVCVAPNSFQQSVEYNGKAGDTLKFTYREYSSNMVRAPFTTEFTIDLKEGSTVGYKGAKLEVIKATNTSIDYKVLSNFNG